MRKVVFACQRGMSGVRDQDVLAARGRLCGSDGRWISELRVGGRKLPMTTLSDHPNSIQLRRSRRENALTGPCRPSAGDRGFYLLLSGALGAYGRARDR